ncbi:hypothetical protein, conserved [Babesia bigemina]|uniref:Uncharacterized protein n=1 Tax=Babesia bigemina TaxID=5866 RepID=A0A061D0Q8_BABBI|nr:hypothetical protein, conserved [Babesia bigemina]CDR93722.1 hypothetical protein, conserved [Babesia bigemina]|eukprot:XP_012765908.1 hypothetical protein, conserved [Babesia bigemina]
MATLHSRIHRLPDEVATPQIPVAGKPFLQLCQLDPCPLVLTFALHHLLRNYNFFVNYSCSARSSRYIILCYMIQMILIGALLLVTILLGRLCNLFSNYSLADCTYSKRLINILGFTIKWLPSMAGMLMFALVSLQFACLVWTLANSRQWCFNRFNESAVNAVKNCRIIHQQRAACKLNFTITTRKEIRECNNPQYLIKKRIIFLALSDEDKGCTIEDIAVCNALAKVFTNEAATVMSAAKVDWNSPQLVGCLGRLPEAYEPLFDTVNPSDLYKFLMLFNIMGTVFNALIVIFFYVVRYVTVFDAVIYQPRNSNDNIAIKVMRPITMWA